MILASDSGGIVLIGGFTSGGCVNRNAPNVDHTRMEVMGLMVTTSGLNSCPHMPLGKLLLHLQVSSQDLSHQMYVSSLLLPFADNSHRYIVGGLGPHLSRHASMLPRPVSKNLRSLVD
ncbi:hypothetical protein JVT61DRAFT_14226 [Boletus reticuloceps]|uniref:Uncharacterized protein n=1 Tax=Boletus reticuloceps TaxID=495285 RepID=A0A8I3A464_9AGAM|nr:hypothetical protein JVT61DRAFT_1444 [Boletus reticuloceps]KAG6369605.1 hypothetical protein JVT61DRAFT_14226 [Boletus reticuloceps]